MGEFDDNLWTDLLEQHGPALVTAERAPASRGRRRPAVLTAVGAFGAAGLAAVLALAFTATSAAPAFAVTANSDGTVTVSIRAVEGVAGANARLAQLGVRAKAVVADPNCPVPAIPADTFVMGGPGAPSDPAVDNVIIQTSSIPAGQTLLLVAQQVDGGGTALALARVPDPAPDCYRGPLRSSH